MGEKIDQVELRVVSPKGPLTGLDAAHRRLVEIAMQIDRVNAKLTGLFDLSTLKRSAATLATLFDPLKQTSSKSGRSVIPFKEMAGVMKHDAAAFEGFVKTWSKKNRDLARSAIITETITGKGGATTSVRGFSSAAKAGQVAELFENKLERDLQGRLRKLGVGSPMSNVQGPTSSGGGPIPLTVPAAQILAVLGPGMVNLIVPTSQVGVPPLGGPGGAGTPKPPKGGTPSGGAGGGGAGGPLGTLIHRAETDTGKITQQWAKSNGDFVRRQITANKTVQTDIEPLRKKAQDQLRDNVRKELEQVREKSKIGQPLPTAIAQMKQSAATLRAMAIPPEVDKPFAQKTIIATAQKLEDRADKMQRQLAVQQESQASEAAARSIKRQNTILENRAKAQADSAKAEEALTAKESQERAAAGARGVQRQNTILQNRAKAQEATAKAEEQLAKIEAGQAIAVRGHAQGEAVLAQLQAQGYVTTERTKGTLGGGGKSSRIVTATKEEGGQMQQTAVRFNFMDGKKAGAEIDKMTRAASETRGQMGMMGGDFIKMYAKFATWALIVGSMYKAVGLVTSSLKTMMDVGAQAARLDQVFRHVGGTTQELASDVLHLAAVNGRSGQEAMESAIQWSRLGLTKVQVNEAVRVSLMAANVAELTTAEATEKLQAIMQNYGLTVGNLRTVLGEMNQISNTYNVTNADMLEGISRTGAIAKQAGVPLAELMGLLGATIGATAQSGANIGNMLKSVMLALSNPALQQKLRGGFNFEVTTGGEDLKGMSQILGELFVKYQALGQAERQSMLFSIAGKTQASRLAALLENYVRAQTLAINAQLNLNSAEIENTKIKAALKAQLTGLITEWGRFAVVQGARGPMAALQGTAGAFRNVLALMNTKAGSFITTGFLGLLAASSAKMLLTGITMRQAGEHAGFFGRSMQKIAAAMGALNAISNQGIARFARPAQTFLPGGAAGPMLPAQGTLYQRLTAGVNSFANAHLQLARSAALSAASLSHWGFMARTASISARTFQFAIGGLAKALALTMAAVAEFIVPILVFAGVIKAFNMGMESLGLSSDAAESKLAGFNAEAEKARESAAGLAEAANLFRTAQEAVKSGMSGDSLKKLIAQSSEVAYANEPDLGKRARLEASFKAELAAMQKRGDQAGVINAFESRRNALLDERKKKLQDEFEALRKTERVNADEITRLQARQAGPFRFIGADTRARRIAELQAQQAQAGTKATQNLVSQTEADESRLQYDTKHQTALESQKIALESIAEIFHSIATSNPFEKAANDLAALTAQIGALKVANQILTQQDKADVAGRADRQERLAKLKADELEMRGALADKQAEIEKQSSSVGSGFLSDQGAANLGQALLGGSSTALEKVKTARGEAEKLRRDIDVNLAEQSSAAAGRLPGQETGFMSREKQRQANDQAIKADEARREGIRRNLEYAAAQTEMQFGRDRARRDVIPFEHGRDETDKLLNVQAGLRANLALLAQQDQNYATIAERMQLLHDLETNRLKLADRGNELLREEGQMRDDMIKKQREFQKSLLTAGPGDLLRKMAAMQTTFDKRGNIRSMTGGEFMSYSPQMREDIGNINPRYNPEMIGGNDERARLRRSGQDRNPESDVIGIGGEIAALQKTLAAMLPKQTAAFDNAAVILGTLAGNASLVNDQFMRLQGLLANIGGGVPRETAFGPIAPTFKGQFSGLGSGERVGGLVTGAINGE